MKSRQSFFIAVVFPVLFTIMLGCGEEQKTADTKELTERQIAWFKEAKFGMFIHWSIPSVPDEDWQRIIGKARDDVIDREPMWSMRRGKIPVETYEKLAAEFNPVEYDAEKFVSIAKAAGMKYIVLTAKHHDGFAMFDSKVSEFDVADATPYKKDIIKPLARACKKAGIKLCFYYSHAQDWHHPGGAGNDWDYKPEEKDFAEYFEQKCKRQVRELLTKYGDTGLMWFDTPAVISPEQSEELYQFVKSIQPGCLVNSRVGHGYGDYVSTGDNQIPEAVTDFPWEVPATINNHWSWTEGQRWKEPEETIRKLVYVTSRGGNYLLNVGPDPLGRIPDKSAENLKVMGDWLAKNGAAIYGASVNPFHCNFEWGAVTAKEGFIYLHIMTRPEGDIKLHGVRNEVLDCYAVDGGRGLEFRNDKGGKELIIKLPDNMPDPYVNVIAIKIDGAADIDTTPVQQEGKITLPCSGLPLTFGRHGFAIQTVPIDGARVHKEKGETKMELSTDGSYIENWLDENQWLSWNFKVTEPGLFRIDAFTAKSPAWGEGRVRQFLHPGYHDVKVTVADKEISGFIGPNDKVRDRNDVMTLLGYVNIDKPGTYTLTFKADKINKKKRIGLMLKSVRLLLEK